MNESEYFLTSSAKTESSRHDEKREAKQFHLIIYNVADKMYVNMKVKPGCNLFSLFAFIEGKELK